MSDDGVLNDGNPIEMKPVKKRKPRRAKTQTTPKQKTTVPVLGVYKIVESAHDLVLATEDSACYDVRACMYTDVEGYDKNNMTLIKHVQHYSEMMNDGVVIEPGERLKIPTGLILDIPRGYSVRVHPRSGISYKVGLILANCEGIVDSDYVHELFVVLSNTSNKREFLGEGDRIAQIELVKKLDYTIQYIETRPTQKTSRNGGFGHTGK